MKETKNRAPRDIIVVGFALFSMFFGAGNVIFPPYLGMESGWSRPCSWRWTPRASMAWCWTRGAIPPRWTVRCSTVCCTQATPRRVPAQRSYFNENQISFEWIVDEGGAVIRFAPIDIDKQQYASVHGENENISVEEIHLMVDFYRKLIGKYK